MRNLEPVLLPYRPADRPYVGRFAPSPTGEMHLGIARTALVAWLDARAHGGQWLLRMEDVDLNRVVADSASSILADLDWLGLDHDGAVVVQSERFERYNRALERLAALGRTFACTCSRREIREASAPHGPSDEGPRYPGTCRDRFRPRVGRAPAIRLRTEPGDRVVHRDRRLGPIDQDVHAVVGDFVLRRSDRLWAYQLAVTVDDLEQGVTCVVRGEDLAGSTARQLLLRSLLDPNAPPLETLHVPLMRDAQGRRLAKRDRAASVREAREAGEDPARLVGRLASSLGLVPPDTICSPSGLIDEWRRRLA